MVGNMRYEHWVEGAGSKQHHLTLVNKMGAAVVPVAVVTGFWAIIGIILPFIVAKGPNKGRVIQVVLVLTASTCWLFWLLSYMHQMNPLIGPQLHNTTILALLYLWDGNITLEDLQAYQPSDDYAHSAIE
nr:V-type proton ATPase subunit e 2-like [Cherax quadricarinatus]